MSYYKASVTYISMGPTCLPAEILKAGGLRSCSYGFDWCRSGGFFVSEYLRLSTDIFLDKYVYEPNLRLVQFEKPSAKNDETPEVVPIDPVYGFSYLYFPHRDYRLEATASYFERCFKRLDDELQGKRKKKIFIVADYCNKEGSIYLRNAKSVVSMLGESIRVSRFAGLAEVSGIMLVRIELLKKEAAEGRDIEYSVEMMSSKSALILVKVRWDLDKRENQEILYGLIARCIMKTACLMF